DAVAAYWIAMEKCEPGEVYNIGGTATMSVGEFLGILKGLARCPISSRQDPALLRPSDVTLQIPDTARFRARTGWEPRYTLPESTAMLLEHCRAEARRQLAARGGSGGRGGAGGGGREGGGARRGWAGGARWPAARARARVSAARGAARRSRSRARACGR